MSNILILGGGSVKGAFQIGALKKMIEDGFYPDKIYGISVGSLNGALLSYYHEYFRNHSSTISLKELWFEVINFAEMFWVTCIKSPSSIIIEDETLNVAINSLMNNFNGFTSQKPLKAKIEGLFFKTNDDTLTKSKIELKIGAVDIDTGIIHYVNKNHQYFKSFLLASSSIPLIMQSVKIHLNSSGIPANLTDGGVVDVVPTRIALEENTNKSDEFYIISCHPEKSQNSISNFNHKNILLFLERIIDIMNYEITQNDIELMKKSNRKYTTIRPNDHLPIQTTSFDKGDILNLIQLGYVNKIEVGKNRLKQNNKQI